jgi:hypothetical protein
MIESMLQGHETLLVLRCGAGVGRPAESLAGAHGAEGSVALPTMRDKSRRGSIRKAPNAGAERIGAPACAPNLGRLAWSGVEERRVTVEFGPSRSKRFGKAVAEAQSGAGECSEVEPDRYRVRFTLGEDLGAYTGLARLLQRVRHWRATEVYEGEELVSVYNAREMAWCASFQLKSYGGCRFRFIYGVLPRCSVCPLFDAERAIRDVLGENPPPATVFEITMGPNLRALLSGELLAHTHGSELDVDVPDFPPEEWGEPAGGEPSD